MTPLIPERFGCGSKLPFDQFLEIRKHANRGTASDAEIVPHSNPIQLMSIDRVFDVGTLPVHFARLAFLHAAADLTCVGATPRSANISFEFGQHLGREEWASLTEAAFQAAETLGISLGKCHSSTAAATSLTIAVEGLRVAEIGKECSSGEVLLVGRLGDMARLYRSAVERNDPSLIVHSMFCRYDDFLLDHIDNLAFCTDVSGYGIWGACHEISLRHSIGVELLRSWVSSASISEDDLLQPCLCADFGVLAPRDIDPIEARFLTRRELCGPFLIGVEAKAVDRMKLIFQKAGIPHLLVGRYSDDMSGVEAN